MEIVFSDHALKRMKERGILEDEVEQVLRYPTFTTKTFDGRMEAVGYVNNRRIKVVYILENYIKIITVI